MRPPVPVRLAGWGEKATHPDQQGIPVIVAKDLEATKCPAAYFTGKQGRRASAPRFAPSWRDGKLDL